MTEKEGPAYYTKIQADVRYDKRLKANAKLLYGEITAMTHKKGYCWADMKFDEHYFLEILMYFYELLRGGSNA